MLLESYCVQDGCWNCGLVKMGYDEHEFSIFWCKGEDWVFQAGKCGEWEVGEEKEEENDLS